MVQVIPLKMAREYLELAPVKILKPLLREYLLRKKPVLRGYFVLKACQKLIEISCDLVLTRMTP